MARPSIIYITTDGHRADANGFLGNAQVRTPCLDDLATASLVFTEAFAPSSICTPSRASVMTGVHPLVHQVTCHQHRAPYNLPQLPELLQQAGYYTAAAGHFEQIRNLSRGWHEQVDEATRGPLRLAYERWQTAGRSDRGWDHGRLAGDAAAAHAHLLTNRAIQLLANARASGQPFFLHVSYNDPHPPYFAPPPFDQALAPDAMPLPAINNGPLQPAWQRQVAADFADRPPTELEQRRLVSTYYGMIAHADHQLGRLLAQIRAQGLLANSWVVFASDHGDYCGDKGLFSHTESLYDCLLHVPLMIRPPDGCRSPRGERFGGLVDLVDLFPTILGLAEAEVPDYAQGHDLVAWADAGAGEPRRSQVFSQVGDYHGHLGSTLRGGRPRSARHPGLLERVRDESFAYVRDPDFGDEAYDLSRDPHELQNLLLAETDDARVDDARRQLDAWHAECLTLRHQLGIVPGDRGFTKDWE